MPVPALEAVRAAAQFLGRTVPDSATMAEPDWNRGALGMVRGERGAKLGNVAGNDSVRADP
jgi:hypothetical protein